jgi:hypothetical protein
MPNDHHANGQPRATDPEAKPANGLAVTPTVEPILLDYDALSVLLGGVSKRSLKRWAALGQVPGRVRLGRRTLFNRAAVAKWVESGCPQLSDTTTRHHRATRRDRGQTPTPLGD